MNVRPALLILGRAYAGQALPRIGTPPTRGGLRLWDVSLLEVLSNAAARQLSSDLGYIAA